jgi:hypothetical protein
VSVIVSNRFTTWGTFRCEVLDAGEDDEAQLIIGLPISDRLRTFRYLINHSGQQQSYSWSPGLRIPPESTPDIIPRAELNRLGLCRIAVRNHKLTVVYPKPVCPTGDARSDVGDELRAASSDYVSGVPGKAYLSSTPTEYRRKP